MSTIGADSGGEAGSACTNGTKDDGEVDVDCGGRCDACALGKACGIDDDCASGACEASRCVATGVCYPSGFCWENPKPSGEAWSGTWSAAADDVWVVGQWGGVARYNGRRFIAYDTGVEAFLTGVSGVDANHVWAIGGTPVTADGVIDGMSLFWNGSRWTATAIGVKEQFNGVWAVSTDAVFAVGNKGALAKWNGSTWSAVTPKPTTANLTTVWASSVLDVWAAGPDTILHFDGGSWKTETNGLSGATAIWGVGSDVWAARYGTIAKYTAGTWTPQATGLTPSVNGGWAKDASHSYAVGYGVVYELSGTTWSPRSGASDQYLAVGGTAANDMWAVGPSTLAHFDGGAWANRQTFTKPAGDIKGIYGSSKDNVVAVGTNGTVLRRRKTSWAAEPGPTGDPSLASVWTSGPTTDFAVGSGSVFQWNGSAWSKIRPQNSSINSSSVHASLDGSLWAVGYEDKATHFDGNAWTVVSSGTSSPLSGVWVTDARNAWAVGQGGTIVHFDGESWKPEDSPVTVNLTAVAAVDASHVYAVGELGVYGGVTLLQRVSGKWSRIEAPGAAGGAIALHALAVHAPNDIWLGAGAHYDGATVTWRYPAAYLPAAGMTTDGGSGTFLVTTNGSVLYRP